MSVELLNDFGVGNFNLTAITETINRSYKGKNEVTLSNYDGTGAPVVKVGSVFDNNGALYIVSGSDETPTGYSGISNSTTFYIKFDVSALAFVFTATAPAWNDAIQGWYNGNDRYLFSMYKDSGGTQYQNKLLLTTQNNIYFNGKVNFRKYFESTATITEDAWFDELSTWIPSVGDYMSITDGHYLLSVPSEPRKIFSIYRSSTTQIIIGDMAASGGTSARTIVNGQVGNSYKDIIMMANLEVVQ